MADNLDVTQMLMALRGFPKELLAQLQGTIQAGGLYQDQIDKADQGFFDAAESARGDAAQKLQALQGAQQQPMPQVPVGQQIVNNSFGAAANMLDPQGGFKEKAADWHKGQMTGLLQQRAERLQMLEKASDAASERAAKLGDMELQMKHGKDALRYSQLREEILKGVSGYYDAEQQHRNKTLEQWNEHLMRIDEANAVTKRELMLKFGTDKITPGLMAQIKALDEEYASQKQLANTYLQGTISNPMGSKQTPDEVYQRAQQMSQDAAGSYQQRLMQLLQGPSFGPQVNAQDQQESPEELYHHHTLDAIHAGITNPTELRNQLVKQGKYGPDGKLMVNGVDVNELMKYATPHMNRVEALKLRAVRLRNAILQKSPGGMDRSDPAMWKARKRQQFEELQTINQKLAEYGLQVNLPTPEVGGINVGAQQ